MQISFNSEILLFSFVLFTQLTTYSLNALYYASFSTPDRRRDECANNWKKHSECKNGYFKILLCVKIEINSS
ncbi:hypothetical protein L596_012693 [Steinernema carpocapsae]|uniref:Uncharacterized protein n=1 Tax=Steinernema carpocapsae TaxID=34508 RepID=A0A4U5NY01_STECR|nr:hypothetical protein L596_012693 [Steinernema carpocapsae]